MKANDGRAPDRLGERAYKHRVAQVTSGVVVSDDQPSLPANALSLSKATGLAQRGDFLGAIRVLGDVHVGLDPADAPGLQPEDVEQALGDLRRALLKAPAGKERDASAQLMEAARVEASEGRWLAAWDLIEEADERLAASYYG